VSKYRWIPGPASCRRHYGPEKLRSTEKIAAVEQIAWTTLAAFNIDAKPRRHLSAGIDRQQVMQ
ncbi:MAG: hypothetical protein OXC27_15725, partial [Caldilineaceae bacterium]|nr:hypothetical protein [Caldilineaceae bacterium]